MGKRNLYLQTVSVEDAKKKYLEHLSQVVTCSYETIAVVDVLNRVTKEACYAKYCSPLFNASAMDGIAVVAAHTIGASEKNPITLEKDTDYKVVDTGDPIHPPYDAVIMAEDIMEMPDGAYAITAAAPTWQHIRPIGEDIVAGEMILPGNHKIRPMDVSALLSAGILEIEVVKKPVVAIFPTGTEIVEPSAILKEGDIIESNSRMFENLVTLQGGVGKRYAVIPDDYELIRDTIAQAAKEHDMVIINAGSSAGTEDFTVHVLRELGEVLVHGVAIKPGKPVILAVVNGKPVIGLPGYPVSAYVGFENFVTPLLNMYTKQDIHTFEKANAIISKRLVSSLKYKEYIRVKVGLVGDNLVAAPLARGAGAAMSLVKADGCCVIPQNSEGVEAGESVEVELYKDIVEIKKTLVIIGSHDLILDVAADMMPTRHVGRFISSTHVGSMGGIMALKRGEAHVAPIHLLDEEDGSYNISYLKRLFQEPIVLVKGVGRVQGFIVKKGNPLNVQNFEDLAKYRFVNRQRGAGTRLLLDYKLKEQRIDSETINGYQKELTTHMSVAAAVGSDGADVGLGVQSAANALGLDFIPVGEEEYDFAIPKKYFESPEVQAFLDVITSDEFKEKVESLGGYTTSRVGEMQVVGGEL
ncbi:MAG: molybdopterin biosynthesis protein [Eubacteriales bacterium]